MKTVNALKSAMVLVCTVFGLLLVSCEKQDLEPILSHQNKSHIKAQEGFTSEKAIATGDGDGDEEPIFCCIYDDLPFHKATSDHKSCYPDPEFCTLIIQAGTGDIFTYGIEPSDVNAEVRLTAYKDRLKVEVLKFLDNELIKAFEKEKFFKVPVDGELKQKEGWGELKNIFVKAGKYEIMQSKEKGVLYEFNIDAEFKL